MAEERNLAMARAPETTTTAADADATKEELQRRMEEARENITQTVTEIKETVVSQYQQVRESISDTFDWREQYRRHTLPITIGAVGVGAVLGYSVGGAIFGGGSDYAAEYDYEEEDALAGGSSATRSYAAGPITGRVSPASSSSTAAPLAGSPESSSGGGADLGQPSRPSYAPPQTPRLQALSSYEPPQEQEETTGPDKPSLFARFKETKAYDRLQEEVSGLGDRLVDELSKTAQTVVLPMLLAKVKDLIGIDLNAQRDVAKRTQLEQQTAQAGAGTAAASASASSGGAGTSGGTAR